MYIVNNSEATKQLQFIAGEDIALGDLVTLTGGEAVKSATGDTTIIGVAQDNALSGATISVELAEANTIESDYTGTFTDAHIGTAFDLSDEQTVDQTAVVNGDVILVGYNADTTKGRFVLPLANRVI